MARKGTAAGRSGEEKTGGPGGVLRCGSAWPGPEPGLGVPRAAARPGEKTRGVPVAPHYQGKRLKERMVV